MDFSRIELVDNKRVRAIRLTRAMNQREIAMARRLFAYFSSLGQI